MSQTSATKDPPFDGLRDVVAFRTRIAEPDRDGAVLRYRGVDVEELVGTLDFGSVWSLLVDGDVIRPLEPAGAVVPALRSGDPRVDVQAGLALLAADPALRPTTELAPAEVRRDLSAVSAAAIALTAASMRGPGRPAADPGPTGATSIAEDFLLRLTGEADPERVRGSTPTGPRPPSTASTPPPSRPASWPRPAPTARPASPPRSAPSRVRSTAKLRPACSGCSTRSRRAATPKPGARRARPARAADGLRPRDLPRGGSPRGILRRIARELRAPRYQAAAALEAAALAQLAERHPERVLATNVEYWAAVVLDHAGIAPDQFAALFTCARVAGWSAHVLEQRLDGRLIRPGASYVGPPPRRLAPAAGRAVSA